jgi:hypothetical protein
MRGETRARVVGSDRTDTLDVPEAEHRQHVVVELAIRDLKDQALAHFPSGRFTANAAWTVIADADSWHYPAA